MTTSAHQVVHKEMSLMMVLRMMMEIKQYKALTNTLDTTKVYTRTLTTIRQAPLADNDTESDGDDEGDVNTDKRVQESLRAVHTISHEVTITH